MTPEQPPTSRADVIDAIKEKGYGISYRGFIDARNRKMLAIDPIADELDAVRVFITAAFPALHTEVISCEPYRSLRRIIVSGFDGAKGGR